MSAGRAEGSDQREEKETPADSEGCSVKKEVASAGAGDCVEMGEIGQSVSENLVETTQKPDYKVIECLEDGVGIENGDQECNVSDNDQLSPMETAERSTATETGKPVETDPEGTENCSKDDGIECECGDDQPDADESNKKRCCAVCGVTEKLRRCSYCKATYHCSKKCQVEHYPHHSQYCRWIVELLKLETDKVYQGFTMRQEVLDFKTKRKIVRLVGEKPLLRCFLGGRRFKTLWDTGS